MICAFRELPAPSFHRGVRELPAPSSHKTASRFSVGTSVSRYSSRAGVRARAESRSCLVGARSWELLSSRKPLAWAAGNKRGGSVQITRVIPQLRTTNLGESIRFYTEVVG